jgi:predicted nucleic acid-binding protein
VYLLHAQFTSHSSVSPCCCFSSQRKALLLTGDKRLRTIAESKGLTVCGIFWVLDQLVETNVLSKSAACSLLQILISKNKRLPANEYDQRINQWCGK